MRLNQYLLVYILIFLATTFAQAQQKKILINDVAFFNGEEEYAKIDLLIEGKTIVEIDAAIEIETEYELIDGQGYTIVPPLINAHVHIFYPENLKESLQAGVFANLDMHTTDAFAKENRIYNDSLFYSRYYAANAGATVPGGHGTQFGIKVPEIGDSLAARQFVRDRISAGADYIKILKEPYLPTVTSVHTEEIIDETHKLGKLAVAHVSRFDNAEELAKQGVDGFAHIWAKGQGTKEEIAAIAETGVFLIPTLRVLQLSQEVAEEGGYADYFLPFETVIEQTKLAYEAGIPILCGTDAPNFMMNYTDAIFDEMILLSECGMNGKEILKAATTNVYQAFQLKEFGKIKEGSSADFLMVKGNPMQDINAMKNSKKIFKQGKLINID